MLDAVGAALAHPSESGKILREVPLYAAMYNEGKESGVFTSKDNGVEQVNIYYTIPGFDRKTLMIIIALITLAVIFTVLYIVISRMLKPISRLTHLMHSVSEGDLTVRSSAYYLMGRDSIKKNK
ncbi:HAMP domain-containing protein [Sporosarcina sp. P33]|uniref:HAMP domain-containing protein n=1 Tax=Sporosarcina sp. P33 TaxID=1930764 RepID=UPI0009BE9DA9|nr:HAMP domain-containing protein [Sporosarcina sp. P33]ARD46967.1 hypothetical protein SporoP33_01055 [Sporosarcina sp. P33]